MSTSRMNMRVALPALLVTLLITACGGDSADKMLGSAKEYLAKNDTKSAVIQIKNALQKDPDSPEARYLLGKALLDGGDRVAAEVELRKALALRYPQDLVVPRLAQAMAGQGQFKKLIDELGKIDLTDPVAKADFQTSLASAYSAQGNTGAFATAVSAALEAQPGYAPALVVRARNKAVQRDFDGALAGADEAIAKDPKNVEAWKLKGDVHLYSKNQPDEALLAYRKATEAKPEFLAGHVGALTILLQQGKLTDAQAPYEQLKKLAPNHPQTKFIEAQMAFQKGDFKTAKEVAQQLLKVAGDNPNALQLAGAIEFQSNSLVQAEAYLSKALQLAPELALAQRLLIMTHLRSGHADKALSALQPMLAKSAVDPALLPIAGQVYLQNGDAKKAEEYFAKAARLDPKDPKKRTALALAHFRDGQVDSAMGELQDIAASDAGTTADMALISAHLGRKDYDKALKAIDALEKKQPDKPLAANLRGRTLLAKRDAAGARKSFERALSIDPAYFAAMIGLASLDLAEKKPEDAKKRFEAVLLRDPKHTQALLALAELRARSGGGKDEVVELIGKAVAANPNEAAPRQMLIDFLLRSNDAKQALSAAQSAVAALPDNAELLGGLGRAQQQSGDLNQATSTFNKLVAMRPQSVEPLVRLAGVQMAAGDKDAAAITLRKALQIQPKAFEVQRALIMIDVGAKRYDAALKMVRDIQTQNPKAAAGYALEGDVNAARKNWDAAASAYRAGLKLAVSTELAIKLHTVLKVSGKAQDADKFSAAWQKDHPKDAMFMFYLGDEAMGRKDFVAAERSYAAVIALQPDNAVALNNLAWTTSKIGKSGAMALAEKANSLAPNQPALMDTWAMLLSAQGDYGRALELQTKVVAMQPRNGEYRLNLARIHLTGGKKDLARKELDELTKLGDKFPQHAEVTELIKQL
ncbi:XrtA/PEP-CTERM system TPR-repeat protein PrsT [Rhodoferax sp.]|uniref:XrtA/PEP-CTERM system TPR-repeat protein PrsT n=1 Tax=Rhodoferax sp. TaxID=50421 RepID=UPI0027691956|nr:PEP-CTERM system TPR-repeat protein PrsT [Rhodoferax sp.]